MKIRFYSVESGEFNGILEAKCEELGSFAYNIKAFVTPSRVEEIVRFRTELGSSTTRTINFKNIFSNSIDLTAKVTVVYYKLSGKVYFVVRAL